METFIKNLKFDLIICIDDNSDYEPEIATAIIENYYFDENVKRAVETVFDIDDKDVAIAKLDLDSHNKLLIESTVYKTEYTKKFTNGLNLIKDLKENGYSDKIITFSNLDDLLKENTIKPEQRKLIIVDDFINGKRQANEYINELMKRKTFMNSYYVVLTSNAVFSFDDQLLNSIFRESFIVKGDSDSLNKLESIIYNQSLFFIINRYKNAFDECLTESINYYLEKYPNVISDFIYPFLEVEDSSFISEIDRLISSKTRSIFGRTLPIIQDELYDDILVRNNHKVDTSEIIEDEKYRTDLEELFENQNSNFQNFNINRSYSSIGLGDVFKIFDTYYLCIQECDSSLRKKAKRSIVKFLLLELTEKCTEGLEKVIEIDSIKYYSNNKRYISIDSYILDLCSYNDTGEAIYPTKIDKDKIGLCLGQKRIDNLKLIDIEINKLKKITAHKDLWEDYYVSNMCDNDGNLSVKFAVYRVGRIDKSLANQQSILFGNAISRIGIEGKLYTEHYRIKIVENNKFCSIFNLIDRPHYFYIYDGKATKENKKNLKNSFLKKYHLHESCISFDDNMNIIVDYSKLIKNCDQQIINIKLTNDQIQRLKFIDNKDSLNIPINNVNNGEFVLSLSDGKTAKIQLKIDGFKPDQNTNCVSIGDITVE